MLYPDIQANQTYQLATGDGHSIYVEESGNPQGFPVLYCHGGPGGSSSAFFRRFFDPNFYRIILFDQRGCGQSTPSLSLENNTTAHLLSDIELICQQLNIKKMVLAGGSWGTTLALLYALKHPEQISAMLLRGIFLAREQDLQWLYEPTGAARLFPDYYQEFIRAANLADDEQITHQQLAASYLAQLTSSNQFSQIAAAKHWCNWENRISVLHHLESRENADDIHANKTMALMECHYFTQASFIEENQILDNIDKLQNIPVTIIHGRYDAVCDVSQAWQLAEKWQNSRLYIVPNSGHSLGEPFMAEAFLNAANKIARFLQENTD